MTIIESIKLKMLDVYVKEMLQRASGYLAAPEFQLSGAAIDEMAGQYLASVQRVAEALDIDLNKEVGDL